MAKQERGRAPVENAGEEEESRDETRASGVREREAAPEMDAGEARDTIVETRNEIGRKVGRESDGFVQDIQEQLADVQRAYDAPLKPAERADALALESGAAEATGRFERAADAATGEAENVRALTDKLADTEAKLAELSAMKEFMNYPGGERGATFEKEWLTRRVADLKNDIDETREANRQAALTETLPKGEPANDNAMPTGDREAMLPPPPEDAGNAREMQGIERLLSGLSPEASKKAIDAYKNADESIAGGIASRGMLPDGTVIIGYRDGTNVHVKTDGSKFSSRPEVTGGEPFPAFEDAEQSVSQAEVPLLSLEREIARDEDELSALRGGEPSPQSWERADYLVKRLNETRRIVKEKSTPVGLKKEMEALRANIADAEADLNLSQEDERAAYADLIDQWTGDVLTLQERLRTVAPELTPNAPEDIAEDERMTLEDDPRFQAIYEEKSLDLLLAEYRGFASKYEMQLAPDGTVVGKDGIRTGKEPSEFLTRDDAAIVRGQAKEIFGYRYTEEKEKYDRESDPDAQKAA